MLLCSGRTLDKNLRVLRHLVTLLMDAPVPTLVSIQSVLQVAARMKSNQMVSILPPHTHSFPASDFLEHSTEYKVKSKLQPAVWKAVHELILVHLSQLISECVPLSFFLIIYQPNRSLAFFVYHEHTKLFPVWGLLYLLFFSPSVCFSWLFLWESLPDKSKFKCHCHRVLFPHHTSSSL